MNFTATLSNPSDSVITVNYNTNEDSAIADVDYTTLAGTLTFAPLEMNQSIDIEILGDDVDESEELFNVLLSSPTNSTLLIDTGTGTIIDNDGLPLITIDNISQVEGDTGQSVSEFTVSLSNISALPVTVDYVTEGLTAQSNVDFIASSGTVTIPSKNNEPNN